MKVLANKWEYFVVTNERDARLKPSDNSVHFNYGEATFFLYDHLGNTRVSYSKLNDGLVVQSLTDYYPYGKILREYVSTRPRYLSTQHERDTETDLDYRGARYYDSEYGRFLSVDPLSVIRLSLNPYNYVSNNPIMRVDPLGLTDYKVNGENKSIDDGHENVSIEVSQRQFNRLQRKFNRGGSGYERYMNRLSVQNGFTTYGTFGNNHTDGSGMSVSRGVSITAHRAGGDSYGQWSIQNNHQTYGTVEHVARIADAGFGSVTGQFGNINLGSNGSMYFRQNTGAIFRGNQYVSVTSAASEYKGLVKGAKWGGLITGVALGGYEIYQGVQQDGGHYGYNAQVQTAGAVGGLAGGYAGAEAGAAVGAAVGAWFGGIGAVPGAIIGGLIGGAVGAWGGDYYGEKAAKEIIQ